MAFLAQVGRLCERADVPQPEPQRPSAETIWNSRVWVTPEELRELSRVPTGRVFAAIAATWLALFVVLDIAIHAQAWWFDLLAIGVNGVLFLWLAYWAHEASHGLLCESRELNDLLGDLFLSGPFGVSVAQHRWQHGRHHLGTNNPEIEVDQTSWLCIGGAQLLVQAILHGIGWHGLSTMLRYRGRAQDPRFAEMPPRSTASIVGLIAINGLVLLLFLAHGQWLRYLFLWPFPFFSITVAAMNLFNIVEHQASSDVCRTGLVPMPPITRTVRAGRVERAVLAPIGSYYHIEHHHFPNIPAFRLPELRALLEQRGRFREADVIWVDGYLRTLWRLSTDPSFGERLPVGRES